MFRVSQAWKQAYPGAAAGVLIMRGVVNPPEHTALGRRKEELQERLRAQYTGWDRAALRALPTLQAYHAYYKRFKKTYHVQLQLESIVLKGKAIPGVAGLVEAMFMAELKNLLLTAGHDMAAVQLPVGIDVSEGSESYVRLNGQEQELKAGDMHIADAQGIISSVLYGPDSRTRITANTEHVLFTVYAPPGVEAGTVRAHLQDISANVRLLAPDADLELLHVYETE